MCFCNRAYLAWYKIPDWILKRVTFQEVGVAGMEAGEVWGKHRLVFDF